MTLKRFTTEQLNKCQELELIAKNSALGSPPSPQRAQELVLAAHGDEFAQAYAQLILGHAWLHISEHVHAIVAFAAAVAGFARTRHLHEQTDAMILLGTAHLLQGKPLRALDFWSSALQMARKINDKDLCIRVNLAIAQLYLGFGDYESALKHNELALKVARWLANDERICEALINVGSDAFRLGLYSYTLQCMAEAEVLLQSKISNKVWSAEVVYYRGLVYAAQEMHEQARVALEQAYKLNKLNDNLWGKAHSLTALGEVLQALNDPGAAETLGRAHQLACNAQITHLIRRCCLALIRWFEHNNQQADTLPFYSQLLQNEDSDAVKISASHLQRIQHLLSRSQVRLLAEQLT
ncbi:tetratricopeptide repeat protein [Chitinibacter sp. S2-10]|uniref:tetratricopeptide repeat protein n=1 Tax=Chitinibacter sp. S2-10 TaxID=3373597 RepID=UPI003977384D